MSKRATMKGDEGGRGLDAVFGGAKPAPKKDSKTVRQQAGMLSQGKGKATFYLAEQASTTLEELRLVLRRDHGLSPSQASKSNIVQAALILQAQDVQALAELLRAEG